MAYKMVVICLQNYLWCKTTESTFLISAQSSLVSKLSMTSLGCSLVQIAAAQYCQLAKKREQLDDFTVCLTDKAWMEVSYRGVVKICFVLIFAKDSWFLVSFSSQVFKGSICQCMIHENQDPIGLYQRVDVVVISGLKKEKSDRN